MAKEKTLPLQEPVEFGSETVTELTISRKLKYLRGYSMRVTSDSKGNGAVDLDFGDGVAQQQGRRPGVDPAALEVELGVLVPAVVAQPAGLERAADAVDVEHGHAARAVLGVQVDRPNPRAVASLEEEAEQIDVVRPLIDVIAVPGRVVGDDEEFEPLAHGDLPDPQGRAIDELSKRVAELEATIKALSDEKLSSKR